MRCLPLIVVLFMLCMSAAAQTPSERLPFSGHIGPPTWTVVWVKVTDVDVSADLVPVVTRAMNAGIDRQRLLALAVKGANENGRTFVLFWGALGECGLLQPDTTLQGGMVTQILRVAAHNSLPPPDKALNVRRFYSLRQTIQCSAHLVDARTVVVNVTLSETPLRDTVPPPTGWNGFSASRLLTFYDGETLLFSDSTRANGTHHLIFVTAFIVPPVRSVPRP